MENLIYLNGEYLPMSEAKISVMDRGFLFGDGIYEVIPAYAGHLFRLEQHLTRLNNSLRSIRMANPHSDDEWEKILASLLPEDSDEDWSVYLQITRGATPKRDHSFPKDLTPTIFAMATPIHYADPAVAEKGVCAITLPDIRWLRCDIKTTALLANALMRQEAVDDGCAEAILIRDGLATEGAASNLFIVSDGVLITPPKSPHLLQGVTRDLIIELAAEQGIAHREADIEEAVLRSAEEIWMTSSTKEILPVTRLDDQTVGDGVPGPLWQRMRVLYQDYKQRLRADAHKQDA